MIFEFKGKIKPYVRMTQRGKYLKHQAQEYITSKKAIQLQAKMQMNRAGYEPIPKGKTFEIRCAFMLEKRVMSCDVDNLLKAVLDALEGIAFENDRHCIYAQASKEKGDKYGAIVIVERRTTLRHPIPPNAHSSE